MDRNALIQYVRARRLAVLATLSADGHPQAAVVGIAATDAGDLVFDTTRGSRKFANLSRQPRVALVVGVDWGDEQTVQLEGTAAEIPQDDPAVAAYYDQIPTDRNGPRGRTSSTSGYGRTGGATATIAPAVPECRRFR